MNKFDKAVSWFLVAGFVMILLVAAYLGMNGADALALRHPFINQAAGFVIIPWFLCSVYFVFRLFFSSAFRDSVLAPALSMKERDERESAITASAARNVFLSMVSVLILLFSLSVINFSIDKLPPEKAVKGKEKSLTLGLGFEIFDKKPATDAVSPEGSSNMFRYSGLPLSKSSILILLLLWCFVSYKLSIKINENKMEGDK